MFDLNDAEPQRSSDLIPDGTFAKVSLAIRPGGVDGATPMDAGLLKASSQPGSDVLMLDCEFTVVEGPHIRRKFWQALTVSGGKVDEKGVSLGWSITKRTIRGMIESALGIDPKDESPQAKAKRTLSGLKALDGIVFIAKMVRVGSIASAVKPENTTSSWRERVTATLSRFSPPSRFSAPKSMVILPAASFQNVMENRMTSRSSP